MSQKADILAALKRGESLTRLDILDRFGCIEGAARITELRQDGWPIETETLHWTTEKGVKKSCARWNLDKTGQLSLEV